MNQRTLHLLEKLQIQLATIIAGVVVYVAAWPAVRPWDVEGPLAFIASGNALGMVWLALIVWVVAAIVAAVTFSARPEGTLVAVLLACGALSIRSAQVRSLLWRRSDQVAGTYAAMILETFLMAAVLVGAVAIVSLVRTAFAAARPRWLWQDPLQRLGVREGTEPRGHRACWLRETGLLLGILPRSSGLPVEQTGRDGRFTPQKAALSLPRAAASLASAGAVALIMFWILLQSAERGQILFAVLTSVALGALVAHQMLPSSHSMLVWTIPFIVGIFVYGLCSGMSLGDSPRAWTAVPLRARVLPIDWLTAGGGGAFLGCWLSARIHEMRFIEKHERNEEKGQTA